MKLYHNEYTRQSLMYTLFTIKNKKTWKNQQNTFNINELKNKNTISQAVIV